MTQHVRRARFVDPRALRGAIDGTLHGLLVQMMAQERAHLQSAELLRVALAVKEDEAPGPVDVGCRPHV